MSPLHPASQKPLGIFFSYAHEDEGLLKQLERHLTALKKQHGIHTWNDREITAGSKWAGEIDKNLMAAEIILLLVSADFIASKYCWDIEVEKALERHDAGQARVIPVVLHYADWRRTPIGKLQALPKDGEPVTSWSDQNKAFLDVVEGLSAVIDEMSGTQKPRSVSGRPPGPGIVVEPSGGRPSSNTRQPLAPTPTNITGTTTTVLPPRDPSIPRSKLGKPGLRPKYPPGVRATRPLGRHEDSIYAMAWSADGKILASGSAPKTIKLWDFARGKLIRQFDHHEGPVLSLAWSPEGDLLASGSTDGMIRLWRHDAEGSLRVLEGHNESVTSLAWSPDGSGLCSASTDTSILLWDVSGRKLGTVGSHDDTVYSLSWSARGDLASGGRDSAIRIWEPKSNASSQTLAKDKNFGIVYSVVWSHRGNLLASASADKTIRIWDAKRLKLKKTLTGHRDGVRCLAFSSCDRLLASKSDDGTVRLWRCDDWTEVAELKEASDARNVGGLAFHPNRPVLATRDDRRHAVRVWHLDLKELGLAPLEQR